MENRTESHRDLVVWQRAMQLVVEAYRITGMFPSDERFGLISQVRRAAVSIPANIAEGRRRGSRRDYKHFLQMAFGSGAELETLIELAVRLGFVKLSVVQETNLLLTEVMKMLNVMIKNLAKE